MPKYFDYPTTHVDQNGNNKVRRNTLTIHRLILNKMEITKYAELL
jgi:hypothetical protein